jgi:hypothetical protein
VHIRHFALKTCVAHDGGCENDSQVFGRHLKELVSNQEQDR